jgi:radical SAM-linked protein
MPPDLTTIKIEVPRSDPLPSSPKSAGEAQRWKYRARFRKNGDLRFVSHHDLMHVIERMFRRADLRLAVTQGFNPHPKMTFALSLALGVIGLNEVLEFETTEQIAAEEVERRMQRQCPPGLEIVSVRAIEFRTSALVRRALYRVDLANTLASLRRKAGVDAAVDATPPPANAGGSLLEQFLQRTEHWVERKRPQPRRINVRPFVHELRINDNHLELALWITPNGAARPEEVMAALGLTQLLDDGAVIERIDLELYDELPPDVERAPTIQAAFSEFTANDERTPTSERPTAIFDSPMSFET